MTHKELITNLCSAYGKSPYTRYIGYNTAEGSRMYGTLKGVTTAQCIESPVCENLMMGMGIGLALGGLYPVLCFERHDFMLLALDALVNHADKLPWISGDQYKLPIIVRAIVGGTHPLHPGPQHTKDYSKELGTMLEHSEVHTPRTVEEYRVAWSRVGDTPSGLVVIVEYKDLYDEKVD
jgi:pyruvate/2-oxoglutarate/acetoin dehydrogenase E1 component